MRFTRSLALYPIVEMNSQKGLLVGVSSGGAVRVPTGQILWRVDDKPFREIGIDPMNVASAFTGLRNQAEIARVQREMTEAITATSTVASGAQAQEMLREMRDGHSLLFRQKQSAAAYGLPSAATKAVGQYSDNGGYEAIPLDASFESGLTACGIS